MCGITGIITFNEQGKELLPRIRNSVQALIRRGPDSQDFQIHSNTALGHSRLSIIDPRPEGSQPMTDVTGRYIIVFNGEFYNFREHRKDLEQKGYKFHSLTDTEVLLGLYITKGIGFLKEINGCFAFAIYDKEEQTTIIVRDRFGIKPLVYWQDNDFLLFSSEIKGITAVKQTKNIDKESLTAYFQLNYIPHPGTIYSEIKKLKPGHYIKVQNNKVEIKQYFDHTEIPAIKYQDYTLAKRDLIDNLSASVERRLVSDVPLGCFLSGGIDSSIVAGLASQKVSGLKTFSVGYSDNKFYDETEFANLVAKKFGTNHTVFSLSNNDLLDSVFSVLDYFDEPFADSSAIPVYILAQKTKQHVTVALSGDGADEVFAGYFKHDAFDKIKNTGQFKPLLKAAHSILKHLPQSRNNKIGNLARKASKFADVASLPSDDLYWRLCSIWKTDETAKLLRNPEFKKTGFYPYSNPKNLEESLLNDIEMVLASDMLFKVDSMSMSNGLEVRVPFLDKEVYAYGFSIPDRFKLERGFKKKIVQDAFRDILPEELYKRPKHGFEVPLLNWLKNELAPTIDKYLDEKLIEDQGIFNTSEIIKLRRQLHSYSPEDSPAKIWALICFQHWWIYKYNN